MSEWMEENGGPGACPQKFLEVQNTQNVGKCPIMNGRLSFTIPSTLGTRAKK